MTGGRRPTVRDPDRDLGLGIAFAASDAAATARRLAIGVPIAGREWTALAESDPGITLLELLAYAGDVLSYEQDQAAEEAYLEARRGKDGRSLRIALGPSLRPAVCLIVDGSRAYVLMIGSETDDTTVRFGDGRVGQRPPASVRGLEARYRRGPEGNGEIDMRGLELDRSFAVLVVGDPKGTGRCVHVWRSAEREGRP